MILYIKNMVCTRCKMTVSAELEKLGLHPLNIDLGEVELKEDLGPEARERVAAALRVFGFEMIDDRKGRIIEKIKTLIVELVQKHHNEVRQNLSDFLADALHLDYTYVSNLFAQVEGTTIEQFYIAQKIEKVKELLVYDEFTLSEIADMLNYSSVAYLSSQFKKVVGLTPSHFKKIGSHKRIPLDHL